MFIQCKLLLRLTAAPEKETWFLCLNFNNILDIWSVWFASKEPHSSAIVTFVVRGIAVKLAMATSMTMLMLKPQHLEEIATSHRRRSVYRVGSSSKFRLEMASGKHGDGSCSVFPRLEHAPINKTFS